VCWIWVAAGLRRLFLRREFGVEVWAVDLWFSPSENLRRIRDAGVDGHVFPIRASARSLPFAVEFFDAIVSVDSLSITERTLCI
jgi:cyclopropane fatty-acyl-phospholipid synthase-like methyltransferase